MPPDPSPTERAVPARFEREVTELPDGRRLTLYTRRQPDPQPPGGRR